MSHVFKSKLVRISSKHATTKNPNFPNSDFSVQFQKTTSDAFNKCIGCKVEEVAFVNIFYNVRENINDILVIQENGKPSTNIQIPKGFYSPLSLANELKTQIDAYLISTSVVISLVPNSKLFKFVFSGTTARIINGGSSLALSMGFTTINPPFTSTIIADYFPKLGGLDHAYLHSNLGNDNLFDSQDGLKKDVLKVIPMTSAFGSTQIFSAVDDYDRIVYGGNTGRPLSVLKFRLTNADGELLDLQQHHLKIILKLFYK